MKQRRLTISIFLTLALLTTPKVWQKFNDLLAAVQHQAHARFVDIALSSQAREYAQSVLTPLARADEAMVSCSQMDKDEDYSWTTSGAPHRPARAKRRAAINSSAGTNSVAFNNSRRADRREPSIHLAVAVGNQLTMRPVAFAPLSSSRSDLMEVVTLPQPESFAPLLGERDPALSIKLRKVLDETKVLHKIRLSPGRNISVLPVS